MCRKIPMNQSKHICFFIFYRGGKEGIYSESWETYGEHAKKCVKIG